MDEALVPCSQHKLLVAEVEYWPTAGQVPWCLPVCVRSLAAWAAAARGAAAGRPCAASSGRGVPCTPQRAGLQCSSWTSPCQGWRCRTVHG